MTEVETVEWITVARQRLRAKGLPSDADALWIGAGALIAHGQDCRFEYAVRPAEDRWLEWLVEQSAGSRTLALSLAAALIMEELDRLAAPEAPR